MVPIYNWVDRSIFGNYRPVSLTSVVCKQKEHIIAGQLRHVWEMSGWLYEGQHGSRPGYSCQSQLVTVCQDIGDSMDEGIRRDTIIMDVSNAFDLVPHDRLLTKMAATGLDLRVVVWVKEFLLGSSQRVRVEGKLSEEFRVTSGVSKGSVLGSPIFLADDNDVWRNLESNIWLFLDDCTRFWKTTDSSDIDNTDIQPKTSIDEIILLWLFCGC